MMHTMKIFWLAAAFAACGGETQEPAKRPATEAPSATATHARAHEPGRPPDVIDCNEPQNKRKCEITELLDKDGGKP